MNKKKIFTIYWLSGNIEEISGTSKVNALNSAGIGAGAIGAIDFVKEGKDNGSYIFIKTQLGKVWVNKKYQISLEID